MNKLSGNARLLTAAGTVLAASVGVLFLASGPGPSGTGFWQSVNGVQQPVTVPIGPFNGCTKLDDAGSLTCHEVTGWEGPIAVDATATIWTSPPLAAGERIDQAVLLDLQLPGANYAAGNGSARYAWFAIATPQSDGGVLITNALDAGPVSIDYAYGPSLPGSALASVTQCVGDSGKWNAVCEQAYCPLGCSTSVNIDYDLRPRAPFTAQVLAIAPSSGTTAGGTPVVISLNGGATGTTSCTLNGVACTGLTVVNDYEITCTSAAGTAGVGNVACATPSSPSPLVNGWTYSTGAVPTLAAVWPLVFENGQTLTFHGTHFTNGTPTASIGGIAGVAMTVTTDILATAIAPGVTVSGSAQSVTVTNGAGTSNAVSLYSPLTSSDCAWEFSSCVDTETIATGSVSAWTDNTFTYTMTQAYSFLNPTFSTSSMVGSTPTTNFNGSSQFLETSTFATLATGMAILAIANPTSVSGTEDMVGNATGSIFAGFHSSNMYLSAGVTLTGAATTGAHLFYYVTGTSGSLWIDNTIAATGSSGTNAFSGGISMGEEVDVGGYYFPGYIQSVFLCASLPGSTHLGYLRAVSQTIAGSP